MDRLADQGCRLTGSVSTFPQVPDRSWRPTCSIRPVVREVCQIPLICSHALNSETHVDAECDRGKDSKPDDEEQARQRIFLALGNPVAVQVELDEGRKRFEQKEESTKEEDLSVRNRQTGGKRRGLDELGSPVRL